MKLYHKQQYNMFVRPTTTYRRKKKNQVLEGTTITTTSSMVKQIQETLLQ